MNDGMNEGGRVERALAYETPQTNKQVNNEKTCLSKITHLRLFPTFAPFVIPTQRNISTMRITLQRGIGEIVRGKL